MEKAAALKLCVNDLVHKYCTLSYRSTITANRKYAAKNGLKRHWDGEDGEDFEDWSSKNRFIGMIRNIHVYIVMYGLYCIVNSL